MANSKRMDSALAHLLKSLAGNSLLSRKTVDDMLDQLNFGDNGVLKEELYGTGSKAKSPPTLYDTLEVAQSASPEEIKASYRRLAKAHHPDVGGDSDKFHEIASAYRILSDGKQRLRYDKSLALTYVVKSKTVDDPLSYRASTSYAAPNPIYPVFGNGSSAIEFEGTSPLPLFAIGDTLYADKAGNINKHSGAYLGVVARIYAPTRTGLAVGGPFNGRSMFKHRYLVDYRGTPASKKTITVNFISRQPWAIAPRGTYVRFDYYCKVPSQSFSIVSSASYANGLVVHLSVTPIGEDVDGQDIYSHDYTIEIL